jgi:hypothetical protein
VDKLFLLCLGVYRVSFRGRLRPLWDRPWFRFRPDQSWN